MHELVPFGHKERGEQGVVGLAGGHGPMDPVRTGR